VVIKESDTKFDIDKSAVAIGVNKSVFQPDSLFRHDININTNTKFKKIKFI
jgi:hypothetical protein